MTRKLILLPVLVCLIAAGLTAQRPKLPEGLTVQLDRSTVNLYDTVTGKVDGLGPGEKFTVDLVDVHGRVTARQELKRTGFRGTPFRLQVRWFSTPVMTVLATGDSKRTGKAQLRCIPPSHGWETYLLVTADVSVASHMDRANVLRLLGFQTGLAGDASAVSALSSRDLRALVSGGTGGGFAVTAGDVATALRDFETRTTKSDYSALRRIPCLSAANVSATTLAALNDRVTPLATYNPVGYVLLDHPGITPENRAIDFCFDPETLTAFRTWLKRRYAGVGVLSRRWDVKFRRWEDVTPMTVGEVLKREFAARRRGTLLNFAPWADHRAFMDETFGTAVTALAQQARLTHRGVRTGLRGGLAPAAYGGYDWTYLAEAFDFMECADGTFKRLAASLNRQRVHPAYTLGTVTDQGGAAAFVRELWTNVANGDLGAVVEPGTALLDGRGLPTPLAYKARPALSALKGLGHVMVDKEFVPTGKGVYLYYSQPSVRVQYLLDAAALGDALTAGQPADDLWKSTWHRNLRGWTDLLDDLGVEVEALSYRKVGERGWSRDVKVLILPKTVSLSDEETQALREFVQEGGTLIADSQPARFDEHGIERDTPALDVLFSVKRDNRHTGEVAGRVLEVVQQPFRRHAEKGRFKALSAGVAVDGLRPVEPRLGPLHADHHLRSGRTHAVLTRAVGRGNAVYLNLSVMNYTWERTDPAKVAGLRELMRRILAAVNVTSDAVPVKAGEADLPDLAVRQFRHRDSGFLFVLRRGLPPEAPPPPPVQVEPIEVEPLEPEMPEDEEPPPPPVIPEEPVVPPADGPPPVQFLQADVAPPDVAPADAPPVAADAPDEKKPEPAAPAPLLKAAPADHRVKPGDVIGVEVRGQPDLTRAAVVREDGKVSLALLEDIEVVGLTAAEIDDKLTKAYREYIVGADVTVHVAVPAPADEEKKEPPALKGDFFKIKLDRERYVYDVLLGRLLGHTAEPIVLLGADECTVLSLLDYEVKSVDVQITPRPEELTYRVRLTTTGRTGLHAFRVEFINPKGVPIGPYGTTLAAPGGYAGGVFHLGVGETSGEWKVRVTDVLTGTTGEAAFTLK